MKSGNADDDDDGDGDGITLLQYNGDFLRGRWTRILTKITDL
jgi:hypothetical protein